MSRDREAVGHSGDEVADRSQLAEFIITALPGGREERRVGNVCRGEVRHDAVGFAPDRLKLRQAIQPGIEEAL